MTLQINQTDFYPKSFNIQQKVIRSLNLMQINEINWLYNKKSDLLKEIIELELKSHKAFTQHDTLKAEIQQKLKEKEESFQALKLKSQNEMNLMQKKLQKLESIIVKNEAEKEKKRSEIDQIQKENKRLQKQLESAAQKLKQKENQLQKYINQNQQKLFQQQKQFSQQLQRQGKKITEIVTKYQNLIKEKQEFFRVKFQKEITLMRQENESKIKVLQEKYCRKQQVQNDDDQKFKKQYTRLSEQHRRTIEELTNYKSQMLSLESVLMTEKQENRIRLKQWELKFENSRRELELIRQGEQRQNMKNKEYMQKNEELHWELKQVEMKYTEESRKLKKLAQKQLAEVIEKSSQEIASLRSQLNALKTNQILVLTQENTLLKRSLETVQRQKAELEREYNEKQLQVRSMNQQFSKVLKVSKENQQLKENNLKKCQQIELLQEQIKRLKQKCNKLSTGYHQLIKNKEIMERENKMLLEEIIFLRDNSKKAQQKYPQTKAVNDNRVQANIKHSREEQLQSSNVLEIQSQVSQTVEDINEYRQAIKQLDEGMQLALAKIEEKDKTIAKQQSMIAKMERIIAYGN